jgi:hypothetical protein
MRFKSTLILLVVFLGLGSYAYFGEYRGAEGRDKAKEAAKKVLQFDDKNVTEISLGLPDKVISAVRKGEHQWEITNPSGVDADSEEWDRLASNLAMTDKEQSVTTDKPDFAQYGLDKPSVTVEAKLKDGRTVGIAFGSENPKKTFTYAKLIDKPEVFLASTTWSHLFQKSLTDLRDKKVLAFETDDVDSVRISDGKGSEIALQKSGQDWVVKKPVETNADSSEITTFLSSVRFAKASDFADASVDAKAAGLEPPATTVILHDAKAPADRTLLIGKTKEKDKYWAKDSSRPAIFVIDKEIPEKARRPISDWRDKTVAKVDHDAVDELEIVRGGEKLSFKKSGSDWKLADGRKAQWEKVSAILSVLDFEKAKQIVDAPKPLPTYGLDKPKLEATMRQGGKDLLNVKLGGDSKDPEGMYLKVSTKPSVMVVAKDVYDKFNVKLDDMVEAPPPALSTPAAPAEKK